MSLGINAKYRRNHGEMITWMKDVLDDPYSMQSKQIRMDLIASVFKTGLVLFVVVLSVIAIFHYYVYESLLLDALLFLFGMAYTIYKGLFVGCISVYEKYHPHK